MSEMAEIKNVYGVPNIEIPSSLVRTKEFLDRQRI
jgi:hypothetical protein